VRPETRARQAADVPRRMTLVAKPKEAARRAAREARGSLTPRNPRVKTRMWPAHWRSHLTNRATEPRATKAWTPLRRRQASLKRPAEGRVGRRAGAPPARKEADEQGSIPRNEAQAVAPRIAEALTRGSRAKFRRQRDAAPGGQGREAPGKARITAKTRENPAKKGTIARRK
jgi:hypothetical protein